MAEGKVIYTKFCIHCHGEEGGGDGSVAKNAKFQGVVPNYANLDTLPVGKMFHSITHGKGVMGSHAAQVTQAERWKLIHYIQKLQGKEPAKAEEPAAEPAEENGETTGEGGAEETAPDAETPTNEG